MSTPSGPGPAKQLRRLGDPTAQEYHRRLSRAGRPSATRCARCERTSFPPLAACPLCGKPTEWVELPPRGRLHAFTTQETAVRFRAPTVLALAEVGDVVLPGIVEEPIDTLSIGQEVELGTRQVPETGLPVLVFRPG